MTHVYFPILGVVSLVTILTDGTSVEAATIGNEGMVGLPAVFGQTISIQRAMVQVPNGSFRIRTTEFLALLEQLPGARALCGDLASVMFDTVAQSAACNARHTLEQRAARWLLATYDRMAGRDFQLTHEFLAQMLGANRPGVTIAARTLARAGLIQYNRGRVRVIDRGGLLDVTCECYATIRDRVDRMYA